MDIIKNLNPLLDLDPTVYAAGFAADAEIKTDLKNAGIDPDFSLEIDYLHLALGNTKTKVESMLAAFPERTYYKGYLTGKGNFRDAVATIKPYKGNRDPNHKPKYYKEIREYLLKNYDVELVEGMEADDAVSLRQFSNPDRSTCIVSIDKDLKMVPGYHYNPTKEEFFDQSLQDADLFFWWQMMVGDSTDNIPGVTGVGPKTADKVIAKCGGDVGLVKEAVREMYRKQYGENAEAALLEVGTLLWMLRREGEGPDV